MSTTTGIRTAQRLWVLERGHEESPGCDNACRFTGAIVILGDSSVHVVVVRSPHAEGTNEDCLRRAALRLDIERDAAHFATLDQAIAWADATKQAWICRGWTDVADPDDH